MVLTQTIETYIERNLYKDGNSGLVSGICLGVLFPLICFCAYKYSKERSIPYFVTRRVTLIDIAVFSLLIRSITLFLYDLILSLEISSQTFFFAFSVISLLDLFIMAVFNTVFIVRFG